jgi:hypothetical protein
MQAQKLGLVSDGHGGWKNKSGEYVAKTEKGKLKFYNQRQKVGEKDPDQVRTPANQQVAATQVKSPSAPPAAKRPETQEPEPQEEKNGDTLTVVFGRFNPPTVGHEKLLNSASKVSAGGKFKIYPSRTQDPKKNPLNPDTKISFMRKMFPKYGEQIVNDENMKTIFDVLVRANEEGYANVNIVVGSDRQAEFENLANKYNGDLYEFDEINVVSAGVRDADAEGVSGMSASKMRKSAAEDDFKSFRQGIPKTLDDAETERLFKAVKSAMKLKENYQLWQIAPKFDAETLRENYIKGKVFRIGDKVENLNTGLIGEVMRRGTNYLICVTEDEYMFKSWIRDVMEAEAEVPSTNLKKLVKKAVNRRDHNIDGFVDKEDPKVGPYGAFIPQARNFPKSFREAYQEKRVERKMRVPGKPNTLVGTGGYFKYASDMTPGFERGEKTNLQPGAQPYSGYKQIKEFINKYKVKK